MKVHIKSEGREFTIPAPLSLALRSLSGKNIPDGGVETTKEQAEQYKKELKELAKAVKEAKKQWAPPTTGEVHPPTGDEATISLKNLPRRGATKQVPPRRFAFLYKICAPHTLHAQYFVV